MPTKMVGGQEVEMTREEAVELNRSRRNSEENRILELRRTFKDHNCHHMYLLECLYNDILAGLPLQLGKFSDKMKELQENKITFCRENNIEIF